MKGELEESAKKTILHTESQKAFCTGFKKGTVKCTEKIIQIICRAYAIS